MENLEKENQIIDQLKMVYDPEIPVNVYDLGLIYDCKILAEDRVEILMTLTSPSCAMAGMIVDEVRERVSELDFIKKTTVELTWDPPWDKILMSDEALLLLGFM
ncbi:FeS assembly SUF system protein [Formosa sp. Hel1_33_131]|jgi:FeS assembly SUF system protein|uniref:metal-sulfur cluster assembly factor n=1 Tax=Formosa sp. Hel1_33_131 TaxID=1336794 RepID=UPI00084E3421|nr:iron-sulfur cluster assembly protein [Formosa sp. Hel1_33_131]AOR27942.1 FeS assembly SUF system protein [Formosa sp. Hel1_33_131]